MWQAVKACNTYIRFVMGVIKIDTVFNIDLEFEQAALARRLGAYGIDFMLMIMYIYAMKTAIYRGLNFIAGESLGIDILVISLPMLLYSLICEVLMNGQTIGKKIMSIRVISMDGGEPTFGQYVLRWITKVFEWPFLFGYIALNPAMIFLYIFSTGVLGIVVVVIIGINKNGQRLGDLIAGTVVVSTKTQFSVNDTVFVDVLNTDYKPQYPEVMRLSDGDINTIKTVLMHAHKHNSPDLAMKVSYKIQDVLNIRTNLYCTDFLEKLMEDYNYLATRE